MSKNATEIKEISNIMYKEILKLEKQYVRDVNPLSQKEMVEKIEAKLEEEIKNYENSKSNN